METRSSFYRKSLYTFIESCVFDILKEISKYALSFRMV